MAVYKVFENEGQELKAYINDNEKCFISIKSIDQDDYFCSGYIVLDNNDLLSLIEYLSDLSNELNNSIENE